MKKIAIIGGSGFENPDLLKNAKRIEMDTPYGAPSSDFMTGQISGVEVVILSRHGRKHNITPTQVNNRANIWAIKELGCSHIIATTACGSLKEEIDRGHLVILDQFIDFTRMRNLTFSDNFDEGVKHTPMAEPFDDNLRAQLIDASKKLELTLHKKGTVISIEGPRFSTRAESNMFRMWGADVINMSVAPECALANEMEIPYAAVAMSTDYDCWKEDEEPVTMEAVFEVFKANVSNVLELIVATLKKM